MQQCSNRARRAQARFSALMKVGKCIRTTDRQVRVSARSPVGSFFSASRWLHAGPLQAAPARDPPWRARRSSCCARARSVHRDAPPLEHRREMQNRGDCGTASESTTRNAKVAPGSSFHGPFVGGSAGNRSCGGSDALVERLRIEWFLEVGKCIGAPCGACNR